MVEISHLGTQQQLPRLDRILLELELVSRVLSGETSKITMWKK